MILEICCQYLIVYRLRLAEKKNIENIFYNRKYLSESQFIENKNREFVFL